MVAGGSTVYACPVLILCYVSVPGCHCWKQDAELDQSLVSSAMNEKKEDVLLQVFLLSLGDQ